MLVAAITVVSSRRGRIVESSENLNPGGLLVSADQGYSRIDS